MTKRISRSVGTLVALLLVLAPFAFSQTITTADVAGVVKDSSGAVVPTAKVTIKSLDTGEARSETSNTQGEYRFPLLTPGNYELSAASSGLKSNISKIQLLVGQAQQVDLTMTPQGTATTIEVTAEANILQTENADRESNFNKQQVDDLPAPGGDLTTLAMTAPGIRISINGGSGNMSVNGIPGSSILYTIDGMDQNDPANNLNNSGASNNLLGANAVGEVAVVSNAYSPQYGRMAGAQVNMTGLTGANAFHGNIFNNYNFEKLNANSFFANRAGTPRGRADSHQFGGRIGGRIIKNKLFFFYDNENLRYVLPASGVVSLPSPQLQTYTLAHVSAIDLPLYQDYFNLIAGSPGINRAVPVTNGTGSLQDNTGHLGCQGTNGSFSGTPISPGSSSIFGVNTPCAIAFGTNNTEINTEQLVTYRADWNVSAGEKISARYFHDNGVQATGTSPINPLYNSVSYQPSDQESLNVSSVITPAIVNTMTASVLWYTAKFGVNDFAKTSTLMPDSIAIADGGINGNGFTTVGAGAIPTGRNVGHIQLNDDFSWSKGRHTFKAGINARYDQYTYSSISSSFIGAYSLGDLADFANGKLGFNGSTRSSFTQSYSKYGAFHFVFPSDDFYVSDDWNASKNLKITFGMRFELNPNPTCAENCYIQTNVPANSSSYVATAATPYNQTLLPSHSLFYHTPGILYQPRIGFAYQPLGSKKTVFRGGIGLFSTNYTDALGSTLGALVPNKFSPSSLNFGTVGMPNDPNSSAASAATSANGFFTGFAAGDTLSQIQTAVLPGKFSTPSISSFPNTYQPAHTLEWNFEIQHQFNSHNSLSINYVANHGYDLAESLNLNQFSCTVVTAYCTSAVSTKYFGGPYGGLPTTPLDPRFVSITQTLNNGVSNYNSLTVMLQHAFAYGLTGQVHYTWSHDLGTLGYENPFNLSNGYGSLGMDSRHQFSSDFLWSQPFKTGNRIVNQIITGWTLGVKLYLYSGTPFSVTDSNLGTDINTSGVITPIADLLVPGETGAQCNGNTAIGVSCLSKADFATYPTALGVGATAGVRIQTDWGNIAGDSFRGPAYFDIDTQIARSFKIKEKVSLQLGFMASNVLNHPNFANPSGSLTSGSFGQITGTVGQPTSIYGTGQGASVSGRVGVFIGKVTF